jgi:hypothetical protein
MPEVVEIPLELAQFQLPIGAHDRLQALLDRQDGGEVLSSVERQEAEGLEDQDSGHSSRLGQLSMTQPELAIASSRF